MIIAIEQQQQQQRFGLSAPPWRPRFTKTWFCSSAFSLTTSSTITSKRSVARPRFQSTHFLETASVKSACLQIHFSNIICLTGLKIGAAPGTGSLTDIPHVHVFALDLHTLSGSRYACAAEHCTLPDSGTRSVRVEVSVFLSTLHYKTATSVTEQLLLLCSQFSPRSSCCEGSIKHSLWLYMDGLCLLTQKSR